MDRATTDSADTWGKSPTVATSPSSRSSTLELASGNSTKEVTNDIVLLQPTFLELAYSTTESANLGPAEDSKSTQKKDKKEKRTKTPKKDKKVSVRSEEEKKSTTKRSGEKGNQQPVVTASASLVAEWVPLQETLDEMLLDTLSHAPAEALRDPVILQIGALVGTKVGEVTAMLTPGTPAGLFAALAGNFGTVAFLRGEKIAGHLSELITKVFREVARCMLQWVKGFLMKKAGKAETTKVDPFRLDGCKLKSSKQPTSDASTT
ncbi:unnamed protein product [Amoebophrya sp. A120]|nr:unnamed protein product [Amoebophrya sp. A120]|eukprot:GSA120T00017355001.1